MRISLKIAFVLLSLILLNGCIENLGVTPDEDTDAPTIVNTDPTSGQTGISISTTITVTFSEDIKASSITNSTFSLTSSMTGQSINGSISVLGDVVIFTPSNNLDYEYEYGLSLGSGIEDLAGNSLNSQVISFTTEIAPDATSPSVVSVTPGDGMADVSIDSKITITFSEPIDPNSLTGNISFTHQQSGGLQGISFEVVGNDVIVTPDAALPLGLQYSLILRTSFIDLNKLTG